MRGNKGQSPIQYVTVILVIVALAGSWMAYSAAGQGATESQVDKALKDTATRSDLDETASDIMDAIRGEEVTETEVASFLSDIDWSSAKPLLERAGIDVPEAEAKFPLPTPEEEIRVPLVCHGGEGNPFWNTVEYGYKIAKQMFPVKGTMYRPATEYEPVWQADVLTTLLAKPGVDMVATTIPHDTKFDEPIKNLEDKGRTVMAINTDDPEEEKGSARSCYIGQDGYDAAYDMAKATWNEYYPEVFGHKPSADEIKIIMPEGAPAAGWCLERITGFKDFLKEKGVDIKNQVYEYDTEMSPSGQKPLAMAAIEENPDATLVLACQTAGGWYLAMDEMSMDPDDLVVVAHDLIPTLVTGIEEGYIEATVDQQPFLQGFYPVVEAYFHEVIGMTVYDINTGGKQIDKEDVKFATKFPKIIG